MICNESLIQQDPLRKAITKAYRMDETSAVNALIKEASLPPETLENIHQLALILVEGTRKARNKASSLDKFLRKYDLSSQEGIALMCLAEALLRVPDTYTQNRLIGDKLASAKWAEHLSFKNSLFVNAATWSLLLTGKIFAPNLNTEKNLNNSLKRLFSRFSSTLLRPIIQQGMKIIGNQFVMGTTIESALLRAKKNEARGYRYSYDMLGEGAKTAKDAEIYLKAYQDAIFAIGQSKGDLTPITGPGISIKLSALHPRYELANYERVMKELTPRLLDLARQAKQQNIGLTIDAEEADRLDISLDIIEAVFSHPDLEGWEGFGLAVQSYQKRAPFVIDWLANLSKRYKRKIMVRLIKGAYWDAEIKISQLLGLEGYPVFTRKHSTDVSFIACARKILAYGDAFYPQFGTHNAYSVATILNLVGNRKDFEFQCLHGMGEPLYDQIVSRGYACRIYAPVGHHRELLSYLVRRLLENGANTSFINLVANNNIEIDKIITNPVARIASLTHKPHPSIPLPRNIFGPLRQNSSGMDLSNLNTLGELKMSMEQQKNIKHQAGPILNGKLIRNTQEESISSPSNTEHVIGTVFCASPEEVEKALEVAENAKDSWGHTDVKDRAACLLKAADLFEQRMPQLTELLCKEAGKCLNDCISEIRETIDFCRYYANEARKIFVPTVLPGPTGEYNELSLHPRGIIVCISPWNFPLAIFAGQIVAALVTGNVVIAKPAEQTPLIATEAVKILHEAGIPKDALALLPGRGEIVGAKLVSDVRVSGVMFTGSTQTAHLINVSLAKREGPLALLIAETGGQNALIVDSSALPEQVVTDIMSSSFNSAGQRCSALRVLFVQEDVAPRILEMLQGALAELTIGDPSLLKTDVGPVIDQEAFEMLETHFEKMQREAKLIYQVKLPEQLPKGYYFAPCVFELTNLKELPREIFGPILHVIRFKNNELDDVIEQITHTGYGLTLGIHSRVDATVKYIRDRVQVGNIYVNRNMIGAVVGVQPFGGERLSGTGPKAGGPHYLPRLCLERAISINTTAAGGNATLISLNEEDE